MFAPDPFLWQACIAYFTMRWFLAESTCLMASDRSAQYSPVARRLSQVQHHTDTQEQRYLAALPHK